MVATLVKPKQTRPTRHSVRRTYSSLRRRAKALRERHIDFIPNPAFQLSQEALDTSGLLELPDGDRPSPPGLPAHLARMCAHDVLTPEQETELFREMNYLKYCAHTLCERLDPDEPDAKLVTAIESRLARAEEIRDYLIKANMRLVMSIAKHFVTPRQSFDEMLSDGILTLMRAVEKFDFDRGFRFSTYAYRSIARNAYRTIKTVHKDEARCHVDAADWTLEQVENSSSSPASDQVWSNLREALGAMLSRLDRRERFIIRSRYALGSHRKARTFQNLADKLGVSKERARQLEKRAVAKLQAMAAENEVDDLFGAAMV